MAIKLKLNNDDAAFTFFEHTRLLGIVAPVKDYVFSWHANQQLGINLRRNNLLEIQLRKKKRDYFFSVFEYSVSLTNTFHYLYNNQYDGEYLLPEFKHLDFLWLVKTEGQDVDDGEFFVLQKLLKTLPFVQLVSEMTEDKIKNKQHLIF
ncbi:MAG TPA: IPExxxVDY family protein, partial [Ferruginibacter sp.]|nr:IPExxxVDY family protein [Ferruginibacter sp.]